MVLAVLCVGIFLVQLDVTVVNVALPSLPTGIVGQQWVVGSYMVVLAALLLVCGALSDRVGHRRVILVGLAVFGVASLGCGVAPSIPVLVASRALQGVGAALLLPGTLAALTNLYSDAAARARAVGMWAGAGALALPSGPVIGGALVSLAGWRAVFLVNLPVVAVSLPLVCRLVPSAGRVVTRRAGDGRWLWSSFVGANVVAGLMNLVGLGTILVLTLYLQEVLGHGAFRAGVELLPLFVPLAVLGPVTGRITARVGPRLPISVGLVLGAAGSAWLVGVRGGGYAAVVPVEVGLGLGMGFLTAAVVSAAVGALPAERAGLASGVNNTARQAVGALGVAIYGWVAGRPAGFIRGLHVLGLLGAGLWVVGLVITWLTIGPVRQASGSFGPDGAEDGRA